MIINDKSLLQQYRSVKSLKCFFKREQEISVNTDNCYPHIPPFPVQSLISLEDSQEIVQHFYLSVDQLVTSNTVRKMSYLFVLFEQIINNSTNFVALVCDYADNSLNCSTSLIAITVVYTFNTGSVIKKSEDCLYSFNLKGKKNPFIHLFWESNCNFKLE